MFPCVWKIICSLIIFSLGLALAGCDQNERHDAGSDKAVQLVTIVTVNPETITPADELPGRVSPYRIAEIRPQVGGIVEKRFFEQGSDVTAGEQLFQINAEPFKAEVASAAAALQKAEAALIRTQAKFNRAEQLLQNKAISRETYENAVADLAQAKADVAAASASLQRRRLDLEFATVRAPIAGRVGQSLVSEGALVSPSGTNPLAIVQQIDKVYVDVRQPASQLDVIRDASASGRLHDASKLPVLILGASGKPYPTMGRALFAESSVDPGTGNVTVRVEVENPDLALLPGMYVRARIPRGVRSDVILVPQEAVVRNAVGRPEVIVVVGERATRRTVEIGETFGRRTIVTDGLKAGDIVVVQGQDRVRDGETVKTAAFIASGDADVN